MQKTITIACKGALEISLDQLNILQKDLKSLSHDDYQKYKKEILDTGFGFPIKVWQDHDKKWWIVGGTQGYRVLTEMHKEGFVIPKIPCSVINAKSKKEAYRRVLQDASSYGRMESDGLYEFLQLAEMSLEDFNASFTMAGFDVEHFEDEFFEKIEDDNKESIYTDKIKVPIYEPTGEKPDISELVVKDKTLELLKEIEQNQSLSKEEKSFLVMAAQRHLAFDYKSIAEFYAHARPELQDLMEKSALVIIDYDKAIENGFVRMTSELTELYERATDVTQ